MAFFVLNNQTERNINTDLFPDHLVTRSTKQQHPSVKTEVTDTTKDRVWWSSDGNSHQAEYIIKNDIRSPNGTFYIFAKHGIKFVTNISTFVWFNLKRYEETNTKSINLFQLSKLLLIQFLTEILSH